MSPAEIEEAAKSLNQEGLARLAVYVARQDKLSWDEGSPAPPLPRPPMLVTSDF